MNNKKISVKFIEYKRITNIKDFYTVSHDRWKNEWRYATNHNITNEDIAKDFLTEVIELSQQLKDNLNNCKIDKFVLFKKDGE